MSSRPSQNGSRPTDRDAAVAPDAVGDLYRDSARRLERVASRITADHVAAQDAVHDTFLDLLRQPGRFDPTRIAWPLLVAITRNKARRICRRRRRGRLREHDLEALPTSTADDIDDLDHAGWLWQRVARLPLPFRQLIALRYRDGCTDREIAVWLGLPMSTVKSRLRAARAALRAMLGTTETGD